MRKLTGVSKRNSTRSTKHIYDTIVTSQQPRTIILTLLNSGIRPRCTDLCICGSIHLFKYSTVFDRMCFYNCMASPICCKGSTCEHLEHAVLSIPPLSLQCCMKGVQSPCLLISILRFSSWVCHSRFNEGEIGHNCTYNSSKSTRRT